MVDVANSYFTTEVLFETWIGDDPRASAIALKAASATVQAWYLQRATRMIDSIFYQGHKLLSTQAREWPRKFLASDAPSPWGLTYNIDTYRYIYESDDVPQYVLDACAEEAIALYTHYSTTSKDPRSLQDQGVTSFSLGDLSMSFKPGAGRSELAGLYSQEAYDLLSPYIARRCDIQ